MKKTTYLLALMLVASCSVEPLENNEEFNSFDARVQVQNNVFDIPAQICAGEPAEFCLNAETGTNLQVQIKIGDDWYPLYQTNKSTANPQYFNSSFETAGEYELRYKTGRGFSDPVTVNVTNCAECVESFNYEHIEGNTYAFTYIPEENMINVPVVFTFAQTVDTDGFDDSWTSAGQTVQKYMDLTKCEPYTWTLQLTKDCKAGTPNNNVWTDFKVNGISKKGDLGNIVQECGNK